MRILVTGSSGLVGAAVVKAQRESGNEVYRLVRTTAREAEDEIYWDPAAGKLEAKELEGFDSIIHLAGENIAARRWTALQKLRIRESRVGSTRLLSEALSRLKLPPQSLISASAVGIYGDAGETPLTEESPAGRGFLAEVAQEWEEATQPAQAAGIRVVKMRFGIILSPHAGALAKMLPLFKMGLGGIVGSGNQYWSWITLEDTVAAVVHGILNESLNGPVNVVAPEPATNREFTKALARALSRPAFFPAPAFALRLALGEMADAALLASTRALPAKLMKVGFQFQHPQLSEALGHLLK